MKREKLIIEDFLERFSDYPPQKRYMDMYSEYDENIQTMFSIIHERLNSLFLFLNSKSNYNKHFNADESRSLLFLMKSLWELESELKKIHREVYLNDYYKEILRKCEDFLLPSGGSPIPDNFENIEIVKYEPILRYSNDNIVKVATNQQQYELKVIGEGAFSIVKKFKDTSYDLVFALKQAKKGINPKDLQRFRQEYLKLKELKFPYLIEVHAYNQENDSYIMEYCDETLEGYIDRNNTKIFIEARKRIALQFLYSVNFLWKNKILHRDLSLRNVLIKIYDRGAVCIKLADLGLMKDESQPVTHSDSSLKGTIIDPCLRSFKGYTLSNEIYSIGMILWFIFTGKRNFEYASTEIPQIIYKCIDPQVTNRYSSISEIISAIKSL